MDHESTDLAKATGCSPDLQRRFPMEPADRLWLTKQLAALFACYPPSDMPQVAWQAAAGAYLESLAHWPPDIAAQAFRRARETCRFRPTIAELVAIGEPLIAQRRRIREPVANDTPALPAPERIPVERVDAIMRQWRKRPAPDRPKQTHVALSRHEERKAEGQRMFEAWCAERGVDPDAPAPATNVPATVRRMGERV